MMITAIMFALWTQDPKYAPAMQKSAEATYADSELKTLTDKAIDKAREQAPVLAALAPTAYGLGIRREIKWQSTKVTPIPGTVARYNINKNEALMSLTWGF